MFKPLELYIGLRYLRAKRHNHFISFISLTSVLGIALGIVVIITVLSVMNGFQTEVRDRMLRMTAHGNILELDGTLDDWQHAAQAIAHIEQIAGVAPYIEAQSMVVKGSQVTGVQLSGVQPSIETEVSDIDEFMLDSDLDVLQAGQFKVLLGSELANYLAATVGDKVTIIAPETSVTPAGIIPKMRRFTVAGIYEIGMNQFDRNTAIIHIQDAQKLFRYQDKVTGLRLKLDDIFLVPGLTQVINDQLQGEYWMTDWTRRHQNFFRAVKMEKTMMFVIMTLIVAVAAFNVVSMLIMVVTDKQSDIAILRTYGISARSILWVFIIQGSLIGVLGTILGVLGGIGLSLNLEHIILFVEQLLGQKVLDPSVYYITDLPSELHLSDVSYVAFISFALTVLATLYPAFKAANTRPAHALRYE
tara:strand:+ start:1728 stop:2975 length:1248 start_codon:yes stop_codon:yes gene_type:complete